MKVDAQSLFNAIGEVNNLLAQLDAFHASCKDCLQLTKQFFALAAGAGVTGSTSVDFSSGYVFFSDALKSIGEMINNFYKSLDYNSTIIGKSIGELGTAGFNLEYGFTSVGGSSVHLNPNYVNENSIVSGLAIQDSSGKVVGSIVFSNIDGGKYVVKNSDGTTTTYTEAELSNWLSKYYDKDGNLSENYKINYLIGNKDSNNNVSSMAWVEGKSIGAGVSLEAPVYESTVFDENGKEKNPTPISDAGQTSAPTQAPTSAIPVSSSKQQELVEQFLKQYLKDVGKSQDEVNYSGPWCAQYAWDNLKEMAEKMGISITLPEGYTSTYYTMVEFQNNPNMNLYVKKDGEINYTPKPGDLIFMDTIGERTGNTFNWDASYGRENNNQEHTAMVVDYDPSTGNITTLEGNVNINLDGVYRVTSRTFNISDGEIIGFGSWY